MPRVSYSRVGDDGGGGTPSGFVAHAEFSEQDLHSVKGLTEEVVAEVSIDFSRVAPTDLFCNLAAFTVQTGGATGTYRVRLGGSHGAADGAILLEMDTTNVVFPTVPDSAAGADFVNPAAPRLVKLTARSSQGPDRARIRGTQIVFIGVQ